MIMPFRCEGDHLLPFAVGGLPFAVGKVDKGLGYIHVLDDTTLFILLNAVDTVSDFVAYLTQKENFINSSRVISATGEEELLAYYLTHVDENDEHDFMLPADYNGLFLAEGLWNSFIRSPQCRAQMKANRVSYAWDTLIEKFSFQALSGTFAYSNASGPSEFEKILRWLAREPRTRRRMLSNGIVGLVHGTEPDKQRVRVLQPSRPGDPFYVFLTFPAPFDKPFKDYRAVRRDLLQRYCLAVKVKWAEAKDIIGIATEPSGFNRRSEDLLYLDGRDWTDGQWAAARQAQQELGLLDNVQRWETVEKEYPVTTVRRRQTREYFPEKGSSPFLAL